ncbi:hemolysin family protein, partial [Myxococcota bacterium]|nr:hemolysin family protein [Myxococcota bacterium]
TVSATLASHYFSSMNSLERTLLSIGIVVPIILIVGEITPKTIAFFNSYGWSRRAASPLRLFSWLITPIRIVLSAISWAFIRLFGLPDQSNTNTMEEDDFLMLVEKGSIQGRINDQENDLIKNVFRFGDTLVKHIMTPREKMVTLEINMQDRDILEIVRKGAYSRVPVFRERTGELQGVLHVKDMLKREKKTLHELIRHPFYVSQNTKCLRLLTEFQNRRIHMAFVLNESGKVAGIVTLEDLLEELVGEIHDEKGVTIGTQGVKP